MRSTPTPEETLRTVKVAAWPPPRRAITTPSKIWIRSLSPSRIFTWTRTVSPARNGGRSRRSGVGCAASMLLMTPPLPAACARGPGAACACARAPGAPALHRRVIAGTEHLRDGQAPEDRRPSVVRSFQKSRLEGLVGDRLRVAHDPREQPRHPLDHRERRDLAPREHVVADRELRVDG